MWVVVDGRALAEPSDAVSNYTSVVTFDATRAGGVRQGRTPCSQRSGSPDSIRLRVQQLGEPATERQQLRPGARFHDPPIVQHVNSVRIANR